MAHTWKHPEYLFNSLPIMGNPAGVRRDFQKLEERRLLGARLLRQGVHPAEVARQVGSTPAVGQSLGRTVEAGWSASAEEGRAGRA